MELSFAVQHDGDRATIQVCGEIDLATCPQLRAFLAELIERGFHQLTVDLEQVGFLDCAGIGVLAHVLKRVKEDDGSLRLVRPQPIVRRVLALTGMTKVFLIDSSIEEPACDASHPYPLVRGCRQSSG